MQAGRQGPGDHLPSSFPLDPISICRANSRMLNRANLKTVAIMCLGCAGIVWLAGHVLYSRATAEEINLGDQYYAVFQYHQTNQSNIDRRKFEEFVFASLTNNPSADEKRYARSLINSTRQGDKEDSDEEQSYLNQQALLQKQRESRQFPYTVTALCLLGFASLFGLILFITAPER